MTLQLLTDALGMPALQAKASSVLGCFHAVRGKGLWFRMTGADRSYGVRVSVDGEDRGEQPFGWNFDPASPARSYIAKVENGTCAVTDIREIGSRLWNTLCPTSRNLRDGAAFVDCTLDEPLGIRLEIPTKRELERLPWEALEDERLGRLLGSDERYTFARLPASDAPEAAARPKDRTAIRVLVVVPEGSGLRTRYEIQNLQALAARLPGQLEVKVLDGRVTLQRLQQALREGYYDILHYIGHGEVSDDAGVTIRFNDDHDAERMVDAFTFAQILAVSAIQLAVLNCCSGESPSISKSLLGLGPHLTRTAQIPAVVAMRYEIADPEATTFSKQLYMELLTGKHAGRIDIAVQRARKDLIATGRGESIRAFITPVLYLAPGREQLFQLAVPPVLAVSGAVPPPPGRAEALIDGDLVAALRARRCIPIVGPGIFAPTARLRGQDGPPDLLTIARSLAAECDYPDMYELELAERGGEGFAHVVLGRVCQHYEHKADRLIERLQALCRPLPSVPPALAAIASWDAPGLVYTHFDGQLEMAVRESPRRHSPAVLNRLDAPAGFGAAAPLIVNLRGTLAAPDTLVLTETDHDDLDDQLDRVSKEIADLFDRSARAVVFLCVSPRDPAVRRMCRKLLKTAKRHTQGPRYFVGADSSAVDRAYWERFRVRWIDRPLHDVLPALTAAATEEPR